VAGNWIAVAGAVDRRRDTARVMMTLMATITTIVVREAGAIALQVMRARVSAEARRL